MCSNNSLYVLYSADNNYAPFLGVSLFSLFENNRDIESIVVYAVLDSVSEDNINKMIQLAKEYRRILKIIDAFSINRLMEEYGLHKYRGSYAANSRIFFDRLIDEDVERVLYLDSDTIVTGSLKPLTEIDMGDACAGVVLDAMASKYKLLIGFSKESPYFNSGVILFNISKWKENECGKALMEHIKNRRISFCNPDQDLLNIILCDKTLILPPEYNLMPIHMAYSEKAYERCYGYNNYYSKEQVVYAREYPIILHVYRFIGEFPWHMGNLHPANRIFDNYLKKSPWKDYKKKKADRGLVFKIEKVMYKLLPRGFFLKIFSVISFWSLKRHDERLKNQN